MLIAAAARKCMSRFFWLCESNPRELTLGSWSPAKWKNKTTYFQGRFWEFQSPFYAKCYFDHRHDIGFCPPPPEVTWSISEHLSWRAWISQIISSPCQHQHSPATTNVPDEAQISRYLSAFHATLQPTSNLDLPVRLAWWPCLSPKYLWHGPSLVHFS